LEFEIWISNNFFEASFCSAIAAFFLGASLGGSALPYFLDQERKTALRTFLRDGLIP